jgi:Rad51
VNLCLTSTDLDRQPSPKPWEVPARALSVFYGTPQVPRLSHHFLPRILGHGERVLYLDGANQIDPLLIARFAREREREASDFNSLIRVSRAFTCFQLTELIERAPRFLARFQANIVIVTALPDLYFDEDIRDNQARTAFEHALEGLRHLAQQHLSVVVFSDATSFSTARRAFFQRLIAQADWVTRVEIQADNGIVFTCEKSEPLLPV